MGVITLSALLVAGAGFYLFSRTLPNFKPGNKKIQADLKKLEEEIDKVVVELIPLRKEDLETFSTKQIQRSSKKRFTYNVRGAFASIFEEPLFKYAYRQYLSGKNDALILAATKKHRFHYWVQPKGVLVFINDELLGTYTPKTGALTGSRSNKVIAQIEKQNPDRIPFKIQDRIVASLAPINPESSSSLSQRFFEYAVDDLTKEEQAIITALTIYELVILYL